MAKKFDPAKAKAARDKKLAIGLGVLLLVVAVFAVPMSLKQWKKLNGGNVPTSSATAATTTASTPVVPPTPGASGGIADTVSSPVSTAELRAFDLFESKDPFDQQVDVSAVGEPSAPVQPSAPPDTASPSFVPGPDAPGGAPRAPEPAPTGAVISVNRAAAEFLGVGVDFPLPPAEALFHLVALEKGKAKISIVGGSYSDGAATATLKVGKALTLENTADGTRYELRLLWVGTGSPPAGLVPAPAAATPTATPSTPTSPPAATTP